MLFLSLISKLSRSIKLNWVDMEWTFHSLVSLFNNSQAVDRHNIPICMSEITEGLFLCMSSEANSQYVSRWPVSAVGEQTGTTNSSRSF